MARILASIGFLACAASASVSTTNTESSIPGLLGLTDIHLASEAPRSDPRASPLRIALTLTLADAIAKASTQHTGPQHQQQGAQQHAGQRVTGAPQVPIAQLSRADGSPVRIRVRDGELDGNSDAHVVSLPLNLAAWEPYSPGTDGTENASYCVLNDLYDWSTAPARELAWERIQLETLLGPPAAHALVPVLGRVRVGSLDADALEKALLWHHHNMRHHGDSGNGSPTLVIHATCFGGSYSHTGVNQFLEELSQLGTRTVSIRTPLEHGGSGERTLEYLTPWGYATEGSSHVELDAIGTAAASPAHRPADHVRHACVLGGKSLERTFASSTVTALEDLLAQMTQGFPFRLLPVASRAQDGTVWSPAVTMISVCAQTRPGDAATHYVDVFRALLAGLEIHAAITIAGLTRTVEDVAMPGELRAVWAAPPVHARVHHDALLEHFANALLQAVPTVGFGGHIPPAAAGSVLGACAAGPTELDSCGPISLPYLMAAAHLLQDVAHALHGANNSVVQVTWALLSHVFDAVDVVLMMNEPHQQWAHELRQSQAALHAGLAAAEHARSLLGERRSGTHCSFISGFIGKGAILQLVPIKHGRLLEPTKNLSRLPDACEAGGGVSCDAAEAVCLQQCMEAAPLSGLSAATAAALVSWARPLKRLDELLSRPRVAAVVALIHQLYPGQCLDAAAITEAILVQGGQSAFNATFDTLESAVSAERGWRAADGTCMGGVASVDGSPVSCGTDGRVVEPDATATSREMLTPDDLCGRPGLADYNKTLINESDPAYFAPRWMWFEKLHESPSVVLVHNFLTPEEADHIILFACGKLRRSTVATATGSEVHRVRTSSTHFFQMSETDVLRRIEDRAMALTAFPRDHLESLQIVRYQPGQQYEPHYDWFDEGPAAYQQEMLRWGGQRAITLFVYLNDAPPGETTGGTIFPQLGNLTARPSKGTAVFWHDTHPNGTVDYRTFHGGTPPLNSTKYGLNVWIRQYPRWMDMQAVNAAAAAKQAPSEHVPVEYIPDDPNTVEINGVWDAAEEEYVDVQL